MILVNELIERWGNAQRVLEAMPEHERQEHWDMGTWGERTDCGTIACAAGHCGLDPWFRDRGFKLDFSDGSAEISDVEGFFGLEGSSRIFMNSEQRSVETVIQEIQAYSSELRRMAALSADASAPPIGEPWPEYGGIFAGPKLGRDGGPDYFLIVGPIPDSNLDWNAAIDWASKLLVDAHCDFSLPSRDEQLVLFDRVRTLFKPELYWSCEPHASFSDYAWGQYFGDGDQGYWGKGSSTRALAVRRVPIQ